MVIDEMEISYEEHGDEDIDINIDIEPGNHDEDFIIEDARSEAHTNDDVMLDEDNASYSMEDADYVPEEDLEDIIDAETMEAPELEMLRPHDTEIHTFPAQAVPSPVQSEERYTNSKAVDEATSTTQTAQIEQAQPEDISNIVTEVAAQPTPPLEADGPLQKQSPPVPNGKPQEEENINVENQSHVPEEQEQAPKEPEHVHEEQESATEEQEQGETSGADEAEQTASIEHDLISEERNITVGYHGSEYSLVASSESDDPDSYFLKDPSVLKEPLSDFFAVLRDILHDEIPAGEELMLTIDDLGLETCETSTSNMEISFSQIVDLHTTLIRNGGEDSILPPLFVTLGTKSEFGGFFASLVEDARQGKGLHEVAKSWNEVEDLDAWAGSEEYVEDASIHANGTDAAEDEQAENVEPKHDDWIEVGSVRETSPEPQTLKAPVDEKPSATSDTGEPDTTQTSVVEDQGSISKQPSEPLGDKNDAESTKPEANGKHKDDEIEGGDFLDYEDEDYVRGEDGVEAAPSQDDTNHGQPDETQVVDENPAMSRRSSSQTIDVVDDADPTAQPDMAAPGEANGLVGPSNDFTSVTNENTAQEVEVGGSLETVADEPEQEHEHEHEDHGDNEGEAPYIEEVEPFYAENEEDLNLEANDEAEPAEEFDQVNHDAEATASEAQNNTNGEGNDGGEISYEDDDEADGPLSALVHHPETGDEPDEPSKLTDVSQDHKEEKDEIDYEDDEEESLLEGSGPTTPAKSISTGKRPHEEDEDAIDIGSQEAKRPRS